MLYDQTLGRAARLFPRHLAVVDGDRRITYGELAIRVERLARLLVSKGFVSGDRLAYLLPNSLEFVELTFACCRLGVIAVPLNTRYAIPELDEALRDAEPRGFVRHLMLPEPEFRAEWQVAVGDPSLCENPDCALPEPPYDPENLFGLFYTSGTTGRAKGVMLTHANLFANMLHVQDWRPVGGSDIFLHVAPMFHLADFPMCLIAASKGATQVTVPRFELQLLCETIAQERATITVMIPTMINLLTQWPEIGRFDLSSLQHLLYGGSPVAPEVIKRTREKLPGCKLGQGYGLTETSPLLTTLNDADHVGDRLLSCGLPVLGVELAILDAEGQRAPAGVAGEIVARGANVMRGYWRQPEATRNAFVDGEVGGWFRTGDIAYLDVDGFVYHVDRSKDMIVSGGENVYSSEVEAAIYSHPCVKEAAVIGIPDPKWGELVMACVVLKDGAALTAEDLIEHCRTRLACYKAPRRIEFIAGELPKSGTNKILKRKLREPYWQGVERRVS
ncbi:MAG: fatty-acid--CoA ligase [Bryobacterales bacterium]|nr:fatty-acid--CoA ligase [Bryobacterales bacterium]